MLENFNQKYLKKMFSPQNTQRPGFFNLMTFFYLIIYPFNQLSDLVVKYS